MRAETRFCCAVVLALSMAPARADDFDNFRQWNAKANQLLATHDDQAARSAYLEAIASLDGLHRSQDQDVAALAARAYLDLATLDEKLGRIKDAEDDYTHAVNAGILLRLGDGIGVLSPVFKRQQVLYLRDGDYQHAADAAVRELRLLNLILPQEGKMTSSLAYQQLPPTVVLARANAGVGELQTAKTYYDQAWMLAETSGFPPPEVLQDLYSGSLAVYTRLHLTKEADAAQQRFERLKQEAAKRQAYRPPMAVQAYRPPIQATTAKPPETRPDAGPDAVPDVKAGFKTGAFERCKPQYPRLSLEQNQEGTVGLRIKVSREGQFVFANITQSSGFVNLDRATVNAFARCEFAPAMLRGQPIDGEFEMSYVWKLP